MLPWVGAGLATTQMTDALDYPLSLQQREREQGRKTCGLEN